MQHLETQSSQADVLSDDEEIRMLDDAYTLQKRQCSERTIHKASFSPPGAVSCPRGQSAGPCAANWKRSMTACHWSVAMSHTLDAVWRRFLP